MPPEKLIVQTGHESHFMGTQSAIILMSKLFRAIPENRGKQKMEIQFFSAENNSMSTSFGKKLVTL